MNTWIFIVNFNLNPIIPHLLCHTTCLDLQFPFVSFAYIHISVGLSDCLSTTTVLKSAISSRNLGFCYWRMVLKTKNWALAMFIATEVSFLLGYFCMVCKEIYGHIQTRTYTHFVEKFLYVTICIHFILNTVLCWSL